MTAFVHNISIDCADPYAQVQFWAQVTGYVEHPEYPNLPEDPEGLLIPPAGEGTGPNLLFLTVPEGKTVKNRLHLDMWPVEGTRDQEVERLLGIGATLVDDRRRPDGTGWVVLADPEGNEFCIERGAAERTG